MNNMSKPHTTFTKITENKEGDRFCLSGFFKDTSTIAECVEKTEKMFNNYLLNNLRETPLPSLDFEDRGNHVFLIPNMSSLSRSSSSRPVSTLSRRRPVDDYDFANFDMNRSDSRKRCASLSYTQPNQSQSGNMRRSANYNFMRDEQKSADDSLTNPKVEDEQLIENSKW